MPALFELYGAALAVSPTQPGHSLVTILQFRRIDSRRCPILETRVEPTKEQRTLSIRCIGQVLTKQRKGHAVAAVERALAD